MHPLQAVAMAGIFLYVIPSFADELAAAPEEVEGIQAFETQIVSRQKSVLAEEAWAELPPLSDAAA